MPAPPPDNEAIFHAARNIADPDRRRGFVREACGGDETRITLVEALLAAADSPDSLLDRPAIAPAADATQAASTIASEDLSLDFLAASAEPGSLGRLGHYEVKEVIGQGGMGIVLRAFDDKLHRIVAIKVMSPELAATSPPRKRFLREARSAAQVRHEHVVDIHAVEDQPIPYLVMEYVSGETLQHKLDRVGPLDTAEVLRLGQQIARGLEAAHERGLIHRDIKPSNILLEKGAEERVKITDFGLARAVADASLTQSGVIAGTPMYMAPEQTVGDTIDHRADLFSLGSVLYTMCSGRPPFRATTSMATLKRVAEDQPRPIREIIPEVPQWLCDIITKLHAKNPGKRFQSAKEVAELLRQHLAHLDNPAVVPMPVPVVASLQKVAETEEAPQPIPTSPTRGKGPEAKRPRRRRLAAAAIFLCLLGGLSITEATGVTQLRATVIRIFTPDGTLVVETDDPRLKVTIEGDGGLVITGAGLEEIRLKPGSYKVHADRDGKKVFLDRELVSISKGGREVVKVKLEASPIRAAAAKTEKGTFVVLGGKGVAERKFDTLADAVRGGSDGDIIEVRGKGPFVSEPIEINSALTIRAGGGFRPVIKLSQEAAAKTDRPLLLAKAKLVLEGLELYRSPQEPLQTGQSNGCPILIRGAPLHVTNCRFLQYGDKVCIFTDNSPLCAARNCEFLGGIAIYNTSAPDGANWHMENCLQVGLTSFRWFKVARSRPGDISLKLTRNSIVAKWPSLGYHLNASLEFSKEKQDSRPARVEVSGNVIVTDAVLTVYQFHVGPDKGKALSLSDVDGLLRRTFTWQGRENVYQVRKTYLKSSVLGVGDQGHGLNTLEDWRQYWKSAEANSHEGRIRYEGGDVLAKAESAPEKLTPDDFRLRPDSAGYRAGKDGKDRGADVDLVGPGPAYELWKKTPAYQQWRKETGQLK